MTDAAQGGNANANAGGDAGANQNANAGANAANAPWYGSFTDEAVRNHATTKQWASPEEAVRSNLNLEKLMGVPQDQILKLPKADAAAEEWAPVYAKLGRPATPDEYKLDAGVDPTYATMLAKVAHENGLSVKQAQALSKATADHITAALTAATEKSRLEAVADDAALTKEWGAAREKKVAQARAAAGAFGLDGDMIDSLQDVLGLKKTMEFLANLGERIGEDGYVSGSGGGAFNGAMTPAQANARIAALKSDKEFVKKYLHGDVGARREMEVLSIAATAGG